MFVVTTMDAGSIVYLVAVIAFLILLLVLIRIRFKHQKNEANVIDGNRTHQQEDIYNISGRVQNQDQWPTHNAHLSIDHISIMNQINKPIYDDAPPSYEEVMKTAMQTPPAGESSTPSQIVVESPKTTSAETRQL